MESEIPTTILSIPDELLEQIPQLASETDYLIVDGPAGLSEASRAILFRTDLAVIPCQPTGLDLQSASDAVRLIKQAQSVRGGSPKASVFISRATKGTKLKNEAIALLSKIQEVSVLKTVIHQKQAIADTFGQAATIWNLSGRPAAESQKEYEKLFKEILGMLK
jgi:chromosome partitioning protein